MAIVPTLPLVGEPGMGLGTLRLAGLVGPEFLEVSWANEVAEELEGAVGRFEGGLVPTILSGEGFLDQGNMLKLGVFQDWQPAWEPVTNASNKPKRTH